jgi:hypothetical protein
MDIIGFICGAISGATFILITCAFAAESDLYKLCLKNNIAIEQCKVE